MDTTVEQTENIAEMATPEKRTKSSSTKRRTTKSRPLITRRRTLPKPKRRK